MKCTARFALICLPFLMTSCQHTTPPAAQPTAAVEPPYQKPASFDVQGSRTLGKIERLDPKLDELLAPDAKLEKLAEGFDWAEGPIWMKKGEYLLFSDVPQNVVYRWKEGEKVTEFLKPSGYTGTIPRGGEPGSNGLTVDSQGRLVLCEHGDRRVARLESDGKKTTLVDRYNGKRFNSPNDLVYKSNGDLYFTDPPYGLEGKNDDPKKEIPFNGVYRLKPSGDLTLLTDKLTFPNGLAFSPDEKILYVAVSDPKKAIWMKYDVKEDGTIANGKVFFDSTKWVPAKKGLPDGMKVDAKGNLWATGPGGVLIFSADGKHLGTINTGEATANCNWGNDGTVLYVTADMYLCRIQTRTRGAKF
jgi:gluconolactonase